MSFILKKNRYANEIFLKTGDLLFYPKRSGMKMWAIWSFERCQTCQIFNEVKIPGMHLHKASVIATTRVLGNSMAGL